MNFQLKKVYSFDVYPTSVLGSNFKNVTVLAVMDQEMANKEIDTQALHIQVYPSLPNGTPNQADGYNYVKIRTPANTTTILGMAWIKEDTIEEIASVTINVKLGNVTASDVTRIRNALVQNGFNNLIVSID